MAEEKSTGGSEESGAAAAPVGDLRLTETQRQILAALCRPRTDGDRYAPPATNSAIAEEVFLSVDAIKAHLRALYRKFGVESLAQNEKRARLVELVIEGGYDLDSGTGVPATTTAVRGDATTAPVASPSTGAAGHQAGGSRSGWGQSVAWIAVGVVVLLVASGVALFSGAFSSSDDGPAAGTLVTKTEYVTAVNGYCKLAINSQSPVAGKDAAERAASYLGVIETMRGRLESLATPTGGTVARDRFRDGLEKAADFTGMVAQGAPAPDGGGNIVAELTFAAGQVQSGALGYGLGGDCSAIGDIVAKSAQNAALAYK